MRLPSEYGLSRGKRIAICASPKDGVLEMLKVAFCAMLTSWMTGCMMAVIYSREIAVFIVERLQ